MKSHGLLARKDVFATSLSKLEKISQEIDDLDTKEQERKRLEDEISKLSQRRDSIVTELQKFAWYSAIVEKIRSLEGENAEFVLLSKQEYDSQTHDFATLQAKYTEVEQRFAQVQGSSMEFSSCCKKKT